MFAVAWQYLHGRAVATDLTDRSRAEWPPHPDRVFQALAAAWGERGEAFDEKQALEWLEGQGPPHLFAPDDDSITRSSIPVFVPANDVPTHPRKARSFTFVQIDSGLTCALIWPMAQPCSEAQKALRALCAAVTHVGHSQSFVRMWLEDMPPEANWLPADRSERALINIRVPHSGRLVALAQAYAGGGDGWRRPPLASWQGYVRRRCESSNTGSVFDPRLIVLRKVGGDGTPGLIQAPAFVEALRGALLAKAGGSAMRWISGHEANGDALKEAHVASFPLAYVGGAHADGHLLGMALALPRQMAPDDEQRVFDALAEAMNPETGELRLAAGRAGAMDLASEERPVPPRSLRAEAWTGPAVRWGTVTPIALDRLPPRRHEHDDDWVAAQLREMCQRIGLPVPCAIGVSPVSPHLGAPACRQFPPLFRKVDGAKRWHVHAVLQFEKPVEGPILLGAGRYKGYGLCKPLAVSGADSLTLADAADHGRADG